MSWYQKAKPIIQSPYTSSFNPSKFKPATATKPSAYVAPRPVVQPQAQPQQPQAQPQQPQAGGGFEMPGAYQPAYQFDMSQMPQMPQEPQVTQDLIIQWQNRAKQEAGMMYDPQVLSIQQELDKAILAASQSAGNIPGYYEDILAQIKDWQKQETGNMQQRYFARGLGRGGGLIQEESKLAETALKSTTQATTEQARRLSDIDAQKQQLTEQAGSKITSAKSAEGQYITSRSADLQDSYVKQKQTIEQQKFQNQMAIQQFGLTAETQAFNQWLGSMEASADIWYNNQRMALAQESQRIADTAKSGGGGKKSTDYTYKSTGKPSSLEYSKTGIQAGGTYLPQGNSALTAWLQEVQANANKAKETNYMMPYTNPISLYGGYGG